MSDFEFHDYCSLFTHTTIGEARCILKRCDCLKETIGYFPGNGQLTRLYVWRFLDRFTNDTEARLVQVVSFSGGPPGANKWFSGTLLTYVLDRILWKRYMKVIYNGKHLAKV